MSVEFDFSSGFCGVIKASTEPLSADVYLIRGESCNWIFDVGCNDASREAVEALTDKRIVISHFHRDHMGNLLKMDVHSPRVNEIYLSATDQKYLAAGRRVEEVLEFKDGVSIKICPVPSSHEKGCLALELNARYLFLGDATYPRGNPDGSSVYNVQKLKRTIDFLKNSPAELLVLSHDKKICRPKSVILRQLESVYAKREKDNPIISVSN